MSNKKSPEEAASNPRRNDALAGGPIKPNYQPAPPAPAPEKASKEQKK